MKMLTISNLLKTAIISFAVFLSSCNQSNHNQAGLDEFHKEQLHVWNKHITDVMIADIFTPPVCSRIYVYPHIAAYEALASVDGDYKTLSGQLTGLEQLPQPDTTQPFYAPLASIVAFAQTARKLVFAEEKVIAFKEKYLEEVKKIGIDDEVYENSVAYGETLGKAVLEWVNKDGYIQRQALPRHILSQEPGHWQPTPPDYMPGIEPHWRTIRTFVIDSASQFKPALPTEYDTIPGSQFYQEAMEVYEAVELARTENGEKLEIAQFWDCNPNISYTKGHVMFFHQKISPGGHWMSIASLATKKTDADMMRQSEVFTSTAISLADAFISCWDEKYRSDLIRPETYIDKYIEQGWEPILQTPPFPEYTSGHSVISAAAAEMLTHLLGDNFAFEDTTEEEFGLPIRNFTSFRAASEEAAISRLYGGIHYKPACFNGIDQGRALAGLVINRLQTKSASQNVAEK